MRPRNVTVIGAGVVGLSCAVALAERGYRVEIIAESTAPAASDAAAALFALAYIERSERVLRWAGETRTRLLAEGDAANGIRVQQLRTLAAKHYRPDEWTRSILPKSTELDAKNLPSGYLFGSQTTTLLIDTSRYLPWLRSRAEELGVVFRSRRIETVAEVETAGVVVVAAGSGAGELVGDGECEEVEGSVIRLENPGISRATIVRDGPLAPLFVIPRFEDVVIGGRPGEGHTEVIRRAAHLEPDLGSADVLASATGMRPVRSTVRVEEISPLGGADRVICCYGHGGAGYSICWGTARAVVELVEGR